MSYADDSMDADFSRISDLYDTVYANSERALIVPAVIFLLAITVLGFSYVTTGEVVQKGIDFTGGTSVQLQVPNNVSTDEVREAFNDGGVSVRGMTGAGENYRWLIIESKESLTQDDITQTFDNNDIQYRGDISIRTLGASVGGAFFQEAVFWSGIALLIMSTVIFVAFRTIVPSLAVIFAALTDILVALAGMSLFGIELTLGSLAALLMLLGYSVDTDILLSTRVLKQHKKDLKERIWNSIWTGSTMSMGAVAAFTALFLVSPSPILDQIATVIVIGLVADLPITWLGNAFILKWYVQK